MMRDVDQAFSVPVGGILRRVLDDSNSISMCRRISVVMGSDSCERSHAALTSMASPTVMTARGGKCARAAGGMQVTLKKMR